MDYRSLIDPVVALAEDAGRAILEVYSTDFEVQSKDDASPLTQADLASNGRIIEGLGKLTPELPIISEESGLPDYEQRRLWRRYWLIDPLDGTREFVKRNGEFTVNIALIDDKRPVLGVVHVPVQDKTYVGCVGAGATLRENDDAARRIQVSGASSDPVRVVGSRSHRGASLDAFLSASRRPRHGADGQLVEILRDRRGQRRYLPAPRANVRMGHGGSPGRSGTGRRPRCDARRTNDGVQYESGYPEPALFCHRRARPRLVGAVAGLRVA